MIAKTPAEIEAEVLAEFTALTGRTLLEADPVRMFLDSVIAKLAHLYSLIELADQRNLPTTSDGSGADGTRLDDLGTFVGVTRIAGQASVTTILYSRVTAVVDLVIPSGHRVTTPDGLFLWATTAELTLAAGVFSGSVTARCTVTGPESNDLPGGAISVLVDPLAGVTVVNTETTAGGADEQTDDEFRPSVIAAPDAFTIAGPRTAYEQLARQASALVLDAAGLSPNPGEVEVYLLIDSADPTVIADVIALVDTALDADEVRPLTDQVTVLESTPVIYTVQVQYWLRQADAGIVAEKQAAVEAAQDEYLDWQEAALGRDVDPTELIGLLYAAGARRVNVIEPTFQALASSERAERDAYVVAPQYMGLSA